MPPHCLGRGPFETPLVGEFLAPVVDLGTVFEDGEQAGHSGLVEHVGAVATLATKALALAQPVEGEAAADALGLVLKHLERAGDDDPEFEGALHGGERFARGVKLGGPRLAAARKASIKARSEAADAFAANVRPIIKEIQASGVMGASLIKVTLRRELP